MIPLSRNELMNTNGGLAVAGILIIVLACVGWQGCTAGRKAGYESQDLDFQLDKLED